MKQYACILLNLHMTDQPCSQYLKDRIAIFDECHGNLRIAQMYLDAKKWKDAFPFILKTVEKKGHSYPCTTYKERQLFIRHFSLSDIFSLVQHFDSMYDNAAEFLDYLDHNRDMLHEFNDLYGIAAYYLGKISPLGSDVQKNWYKQSHRGDFILGRYELALFYYRRCNFAKAKKLYMECWGHVDWEMLSQLEKGEITNDISLCAWYMKDADNFTKFNLLAQEYGSAIAFSNRANGFYKGYLVCNEPDYEYALFWFEEALTRMNLKNAKHVKYITEKIEDCKTKLKESVNKNNSNCK